MSQDEVGFEMVTDDYNKTIKQLDSIRHRFVYAAVLLRCALWHLSSVLRGFRASHCVSGCECRCSAYLCSLMPDALPFLDSILLLFLGFDSFGRLKHRMCFTVCVWCFPGGVSLCA